jgi:hypothetical protein
MAWNVRRAVERSSGEKEIPAQEIRLIFPSQLIILGYAIKLK